MNSTERLNGLSKEELIKDLLKNMLLEEYVIQKQEEHLLKIEKKF